MKLKQFALILALFSFSASLFAQQTAYSFSGFGGGLPSSAKKVSMSAGASKPAESQRIIVEDEDEDYNYDYEYETDEETPDYDYPDEPKVKKNKKAGLIATYVVLGVVVTAGIVVGAYYLTNESADCCSTLSQNLAEGCAEGCGESCGESCGDSATDSCASSSSESCSSSSSSGSSCSSSSGSNSSTCTTSNIGNILANGFELIPVYVP